MLDEDDTRALGRRGLFIEAQRRGDGEEAMEMARAAMEGGKSAGWAGAALFDMQTAAGDWQGALMTLSQNQAAKQVTKDEFRRKRAILLTAQAQDMEQGEGSDQDMRPLLLEAVKLAPGLTAAALMAAKVLKGLGEQRKAGKIVEAAWKQEPHPDLADAYAELKSDGTALDRLKRVRSLTGLMPDNLESKMALAKASLEAREWSDARAILEPLAEEQLTPRICMLMAQIEEGQEGDFGRVREWLARAVSAHRDPVWTADGQVSESWKPTSPMTGKLDAFEWKVPVQELADYDRPLIDADNAEAASEEEEVVLLAPSDVSEAKVEDAVDQVADDKVEVLAPEGKEAEPEVEAEEPISEDADKEPIVVEASDDEIESKSSGDAEESTDEETSDDKDERKEVEFAMPHAPDDPGPKKKEVPNTPEKRFRLF
jgi:HemY protein